MFIVPMNSSINVNAIKPIENLIGDDKAVKKDKGESGSFKEIFQNVVQNVEETEATTRMDAYKLSIGEMDDLHTMIINAGKAELALSTMMQLRNKALDAYTELMRTNL